MTHTTENMKTGRLNVKFETNRADTTDKGRSLFSNVISFKAIKIVLCSCFTMQSVNNVIQFMQTINPKGNAV